MSLAEGLGLPPLPLVICGAMGAVASFLTPIGHHDNLLVLNPGGYRFADFLRLGVPLTILIGVAVAHMAGRLWMSWRLLRTDGDCLNTGCAVEP